MTKALDSSVPKAFPSSTASLRVTFFGMSGRYFSSKTARRSTLRSMRDMRSRRQLWLCCSMSPSISPRWSTHALTSSSANRCASGSGWPSWRGVPGGFQCVLGAERWLISIW